ncbi:MAG: Fe-S cluster assembly ATPase SufC [Patescibacteria group bacterium]
MLKLTNLDVYCKNQLLLKEINLEFIKASTYLILGSNGSGKSTLAKTIIGYPAYQIKRGRIQIDPLNYYNYKSTEDTSLEKYSLSQRAKLGIFLCFQNPVDLVGVAPFNFLKTIFNTHQLYRGLPQMGSKEFLEYVKSTIKRFKFSDNILSRSSLESMSGGEKKKFELIQLLLLEPKFVILDEVDSGIDVDSLKNLLKIITYLQSKKVTLLIISHNLDFLQKINIDQVAILSNGQVVKIGNQALIEDIKHSGFAAYD